MCVYTYTCRARGPDAGSSMWNRVSRTVQRTLSGQCLVTLEQIRSLYVRFYCNCLLKNVGKEVDKKKETREQYVAHIHRTYVCMTVRQNIVGTEVVQYLNVLVYIFCYTHSVSGIILYI